MRLSLKKDLWLKYKALNVVSITEWSASIAGSRPSTVVAISRSSRN